MSVKLILHPGYNKCGSTSIQRYIHLNAELLEKQGIFISDINFRFAFDTPRLLIRKASPFFYFERMMESGDFLAFHKRIKSVAKAAEKASCKSIIITAEGLGNNPGRIRGKAIHEILSSFFDEVVVPIYIRRQDDYLLSSWQQWGHRQGESLEEHVDQALASSNYSPDYLETAEYFSDFYGEEAVQVVPLLKSGLIQGDLSHDFCSRVGIDTSNLKKVDDHVNKGLNPYVCDILSRSPGVYEHVHDNSVKAILENYVSSEDILHRKFKFYLSHEQRIRIMAHYEAENQILHQKYFKALPYQDVFGIKELSCETLKEPANQLEQLKDIISMQMEMLLMLTREKVQKDLPLKKRARLLIESIARFLYT